MKVKQRFYTEFETSINVILTEENLAQIILTGMKDLTKDIPNSDFTFLLKEIK